TSTTPETDTVVTAVTDLKRRAPGLVGLTYDMAMRGKQREQLYSEDLLLITRVPRSGRANTRAHLLAPMAANKDGNKIDDVEIWAIEGTPHIRQIAAGHTHDICLDRIQTRRFPRRRVRDEARYRWVNEYRIPDDPRVRPVLRGAHVLVRLDDPNYTAAPISRADRLHTIAPHEQDWVRLFALRPPTESLNRWIKEHLRDKRAPAVGAVRQHFAFLCMALYNNLRAELAQRQRLRQAA